MQSVKQLNIKSNILNNKTYKNMKYKVIIQTPNAKTIHKNLTGKQADDLISLNYPLRADLYLSDSDNKDKIIQTYN